MAPRPAPSAIVWPWRERAARGEARQLAAIRSARRRGLMQSVVALALATLVAFVFGKPLLALLIVSIGSFVGLAAFLSPLGIYGSITRWVEKLGYGIGTALTWLLMPLIFYFLFLPVGLYLRARKRLRITRSVDRTLPTYWIPTAERKSTRESYDRQF